MVSTPPTADDPTPDTPEDPTGVTTIAFYLPQFHPVDENDRWWGPGFTEWTNVAAARRLYPGHRQPNLPGELGFYDLRLPETREAQADLARQHGVTAFCFWHYWFAGRRILERVIDEVVASGQPDFPFCLAWANPSWIGSWFGAPDATLIEQTYPGADDYRRHFDHLLPALTDPRYLRVDNKPVIVVQTPWEIPDQHRFTDLWRRCADEAGLPGLFLIGRRGGEPGVWRPSAVGFDAAVNSRVQPGGHRLAVEGRRRWDWWLTAATRRFPRTPTVFLDRYWSDYVVTVPDDGELSFPCAMPNWDNTPRARYDGVVFHGATPDRFRSQVVRAVQLLEGRPREHRILFVKSWNEWAEGNYLEPDRVHGRAWLEALRDGLAEGTATGRTDP